MFKKLKELLDQQRNEQDFRFLFIMSMYFSSSFLLPFSFFLRELFFTLDTDKSGGLDQSEFQIFLHGLVKHGLDNGPEAVWILKFFFILFYFIF